MQRFPGYSCVSFLAIGVLSALTAASAAAQQPSADLDSIFNADLETLLAVEVVSSASKFQQEAREAPAAITVITAEDIRRLGHRSLSDVLRSVRGFYTTYDRNYSYVGVRGFARPGDYNTRVLLMIDGHRLNDGVYDMAPIGTDFPVDVSLIDRVEVIRGPGSSLYGTSAFFAVINVLTRGGGKSKGFTLDAGGGTLGTAGGTLRYGDVLGGSHAVMAAVSAYRSDGESRAAYPEFEGAAVDLDRDDFAGATASWTAGQLSLRGALGHRRKRVPTASFATAFGDPRYLTTDRRGYLAGEYDATAAGWSAKVRGAYDYYGFHGAYPFDYGDGVTSVWLEGAQSQAATGEININRRFGTHFVTAGTEVRRQFRSTIAAEDESGPQVDVQRPSTVVGVYLQDEVRVRPWMLINVGARVDRYAGFGSYAAPRAALVLLPRPSTSVKLLHGRAFRAPNPYERFYYTSMERLPQLQPERIHSTELVWEQSINERVRATATAFSYEANQIIELGTLGGTAGSELYFANAGRVDALGVEAELEAKFLHGIAARVSHSYTRTRDDVTGGRLSNSPRQLFKVALQAPVAGSILGVDAQYLGERTNVRGEAVSGAFVPNLTLTAPVGSRLELRAAVYNALNARYADPGAEEHLQSAIPQDGRTVALRARVRF